MKYAAIYRRMTGASRFELEAVVPAKEGEDHEQTLRRMVECRNGSEKDFLFREFNSISEVVEVVLGQSFKTGRYVSKESDPLWKKRLVELMNNIKTETRFSGHNLKVYVAELCDRVAEFEEIPFEEDADLPPSS